MQTRHEDHVGREGLTGNLAFSSGQRVRLANTDAVLMLISAKVAVGYWKFIDVLKKKGGTAACTERPNQMLCVNALGGLGIDTAEGLRQAGRALPLVSTPQGGSRRPIKNAMDASATGIPSVWYEPCHARPCAGGVR